MARIRSDARSVSNDAHSGDAVWRIGIYLRLSREDGNDESLSVINQKKIIEEFLEKEFEGSGVVVDCFIDDGLTGTDDSRAEFMRLISCIEDRKINCVLCKTLSRAFRNYADQGYYLESYFPLKKVRFISLADPMIDTHKNPDALTGFEVPLFGVVNDRYAAMTSNAVRRTLKMKQGKGEFIGAFPPYGFLKDPENKNRLILDPDIVPIKRDIKDWILREGLSLRGAVRRLNALGIPNPTAYKRSKGWNYRNPHASANDGLWNAATLKRMLMSQANIGHMVQGKQRVISYKVHRAENLPESQWKVVENVIEPTFTREEYDTLVRLLKRDTRTANDRQTVYLLSGFLRCADCGKAMRRKASGKYVYYYCRTHEDQNGCTKHGISEADLIHAILGAVRTQIGRLRALAEIFETIRASPVIHTQADRIAKLLQDNQREMDKTQRLLDGLYADLKTDVLDSASYDRLKANFAGQMRRLRGIAEHLREERRKLETCAPPESEAFGDFMKYYNITVLDRAILNELVDVVRIHEGKRITVRFRCSEDAAHADRFAPFFFP